MDIKKIKVPTNFGGETHDYDIETYLFGSDLKSSHKRIFFSHGFTMNPKDYTQFFELLYNFFDKKLTIVAPKIVGHKIQDYKNNTFQANQEIYNSFRDDLGYHGDIISHSAGPNQYKADKVVMINPLVPFDQNVVQFMIDVSLKYSKNDLKALMGSSKGIGSALSFMKNAKQNIELIMDWQKMDMGNMYPERKNVDGVMINSVGNTIKDNVFDYNNTGDTLRPKYKSFEERLTYGDNASIILHPVPIFNELKPLL